MSKQPKPEQINAHSLNEGWMKVAIAQAKLAALRGEVPVGAVIVHNNQLLAKAGNRKEELQSPLGHAELIVLHKAAKKLKSWRLLDCTLYVTLEPCVMCSGALVQARISKLVFGATDSKGGGSISLFKIPQDSRLNHRMEIITGVQEIECAKILKEFFQSRRKKA